MIPNFQLTRLAPHQAASLSMNARFTQHMIRNAHEILSSGMSPELTAALRGPNFASATPIILRELGTGAYMHIPRDEVSLEFFPRHKEHDITLHQTRRNSQRFKNSAGVCAPSCHRIRWHRTAACILCYLSKCRHEALPTEGRNSTLQAALSRS